MAPCTCCFLARSSLSFLSPCIHLGYAKLLLGEDSDQLSHHCSGIRLVLTVLEAIDVVFSSVKFTGYGLVGGRHADSGTSMAVFGLNLQGFRIPYVCWLCQICQICQS